MLLTESRLYVFFALAALTAWVAGCAGNPAGDPSATDSSAPTPELTGDVLRVEDARAVQVPGGGTGAVYLRLVNPTDRDDVLETVTTPVAQVAEVHETVEETGVMRMRAFPEGMPVPARSVVVLEPGGKHVMLMVLEAPLHPGQEIDLELRFRDGEPLRITVPVVEIGS